QTQFTSLSRLSPYVSLHTQLCAHQHRTKSYTYIASCTILACYSFFSLSITTAVRSLSLSLCQLRSPLSLSMQILNLGLSLSLSFSLFATRQGLHSQP